MKIEVVEFGFKDLVGVRTSVQGLFIRRRASPDTKASSLCRDLTPQSYDITYSNTHLAFIWEPNGPSKRDSVSTDPRFRPGGLEISCKTQLPGLACLSGLSVIALFARMCCRKYDIDSEP